jgi:diguanylate cyclase (GGDEF)-like protein
MMPDMDGFETYNYIRNTENNIRTPIIFLTAKVDVENVVKSFEMGAVDYIRKPFNTMELKARVKTHIELSKMREELARKNKLLQEANDELKILASTDPLTSLVNRRTLLFLLDKEQSRFKRNNKPFSIIIADIDSFKRVNDTYGHNFGDYVIASIADLFRKSVRAQDCIARWGGEEYLILMPETDCTGAVIIAEKLRNTIESFVFQNNDISIHVTMTFGVSSYDNIMDTDLLINKADSALYSGKEKGKNCVCSG